MLLFRRRINNDGNQSATLANPATLVPLANRRCIEHLWMTLNEKYKIMRQRRILNNKGRKARIIRLLPSSGTKALLPIIILEHRDEGWEGRPRAELFHKSSPFGSGTLSERAREAHPAPTSKFKRIPVGGMRTFQLFRLAAFPRGEKYTPLNSSGTQRARRVTRNRV